jgi:hypothetical protein
MKKENKNWTLQTNVEDKDLKCECGNEMDIIHCSNHHTVPESGIFYCSCAKCGKEKNVIWSDIPPISKNGIYFRRGKLEVTDYKDKSFADYQVKGTSRCFSDLDWAVLYTIGASKGKRSDQELMVLIDTFMTMIDK